MLHFTKIVRITGAAVVVLGALAACKGSQGQQDATSVVVTAPEASWQAPPPDVTGQGTEDAAVDGGSPEESNPEPPALPEGGFSCDKFAPIKSTDACKTSAECAPSAVCHARTCIAKSKAPQIKPRTMCTMELVCRSIDVGSCGCVDGVCALVQQ